MTGTVFSSGDLQYYTATRNCLNFDVHKNLPTRANLNRVSRSTSGIGRSGDCSPFFILRRMSWYSFHEIRWTIFMCWTKKEMLKSANFLTHLLEHKNSVAEQPPPLLLAVYSLSIFTVATPDPVSVQVLAARENNCKTGQALSGTYT